MVLNVPSSLIQSFPDVPDREKVCIQGVSLLVGADCTPKNNEKKSYKYMSYLSLFMRYNEFYKQSKL